MSVRTHPMDLMVDGPGRRAALRASGGPPGSAVYSFSNLFVLEGSEH